MMTVATVILLITVTLYNLFVSFTDKPMGVTVLPVNATAVRVSWSGSAHLHTTILYTVYYSTSIMRQYERVYPPGVTSADIALEDDITLNDVYVHNFTLYYITPDNVTPDQDDLTVEMFDFGIIIKSCGYIILAHQIYVLSPQIRLCFRFNLGHFTTALTQS